MDSSRSSMWFGVPIQESDPSTSSSTSQQSVAVPAVNKHVYDRYFQQVSRRDFLHSSLLLQYARDKQITPIILWLNFSLYIKMHNLDNTLANLIEYLGLTSIQVHKGGNIENVGIKLDVSDAFGPNYSHGYFKNHTSAGDFVDQNNYSTYQLTDIYENFEEHDKPATVHVFKTYSNEDYLKLKKEAEDIFRMKCEEEERKAAIERRNREAAKEVEALVEDKDDEVTDKILALGNSRIP